MVQRKVPNKLGIKPLHLKLDTQLVNLKPSSPLSPTHEKNKKIMKKSRPIKRSNESQSLPPLKKKRTPMPHPEVAGVGLLPSLTPATQKPSPNYMKSTSSFEARKEQSPKTPTKTGTKGSKGSKSSCSNSYGDKTSSLKMVRTLTKTPSFKLSRSSQKVILCEEAQRATCSSTLKGSKFPKYLQLSPGGTELEGTSAMKVCPYRYCSLNGHRHAPLPPLKKFLAARRRVLKTQNSLRLGCLSPRQTVFSPADLKEENRDFFIDVYSKNRGSEIGEIERDLENSDIDWVEGDCSDSGNDDFKLQENEIGKTTSGESLYDEESVSYDEDSASDSSCQRMKILDQDHQNYDEFEVSSTVETDIIDELDEVDEINLPIGDQNVNNQKEESYLESKTIDEYGEKLKDASDENRTSLIIYNIIQINVSVFINGEKTEDSETDGNVTVGEPATSVADDKMGTEEAMEEQSTSKEIEEAIELNQMIADEEPLNGIEKAYNSEQECNEYEACSQSDSIEEPAIVNRHEKEEITSIDEVQAPCENLLDGNKKDDEEIGDDSREFNFNPRGPNFLAETAKPDAETVNLKPWVIAGNKKRDEEIGEDFGEFNPRGPNFLAETPDPDAETVDLKHQMMDERKNAEEWMVDFALQQAVTKLAPARKQKVALLVEAFEKVMPDPIPVYKAHSSRYSSKAFTNSRPMQACS